MEAKAIYCRDQEMGWLKCSSLEEVKRSVGVDVINAIDRHHEVDCHEISSVEEVENCVGAGVIKAIDRDREMVRYPINNIKSL